MQRAAGVEAERMVVALAVPQLLIPVADPRTGAVAPVRLTAREARARREANEARLARLLEFFRALRIDPVVLATSDPYAIDGEFLAWAARRRLLRGRGR